MHLKPLMREGKNVKIHLESFELFIIFLYTEIDFNINLLNIKR